MAIRRSALERIGGFDETIQGRGEEEEWERRYKAAGGRVRYVAGAGVEHRRTAADATVRALSRAAYALGRTARRNDVRKGRGPTLPAELRTLAGLRLAHRQAALRERDRDGRPQPRPRPRDARGRRGRERARRPRIRHLRAGVRGPRDHQGRRSGTRPPTRVDLRHAAARRGCAGLRARWPRRRVLAISVRAHRRPEPAARRPRRAAALAPRGHVRATPRRATAAASRTSTRCWPSTRRWATTGCW